MKADRDLFIEDAVENYTAVEPSPDLAARILRSTQSGSAGQTVQAIRRAPGWVLAFALPAVAVVLTLILGQTLKSTLPQSKAAPKRAAAAISRPVPVTSAPPGHSAVAEAAAEHPHVFPAVAHGKQSVENRVRSDLPEVGLRAAPYSAEELALAAFVEHHPKQAAEVAEAQKRGLNPLVPQPIAIAPLQIEPITIPALN